ncbi:MAG: helix-turn-helix domain-containing protein [Candidatus Cloacimonetes bacterium]|nr:helix-turn-helix domain-containing protein [Candidatus Cloacimonadota bacterium]
MTNKESFHLYSKEEKLTIINDFINNKLGYRECAQKYEISKTSLLYWVRAFRSIGEDGLVSQIRKHKGPNKGRPKGYIKPRNRLEELEKENLNLKIQIERLKKVMLRKELV